MGSGSEEQPGQGESGQSQYGQGQYGPPQYGPGQYVQGQYGTQTGWPPPPPPGPYAQPGSGWPQMAGRSTNSLAIASLCCAIGQFIAGPFAGIAAIVLGAMSLRQIQASGEDGRGMAMTGLVLGIVGLILFILVIVFALALIHGVASSSSSTSG
jgi:hypothetical protein